MCGPVKRASPRTTWTLRPLAICATPPVSLATTPSFQRRAARRGRARARRTHAVRPAVSRLGDHLGDVQQRLGRDAADVEADAAERLVALDQHDVEAEVGGPERGGVAARVSRSSAFCGSPRTRSTPGPKTWARSAWACWNAPLRRRSRSRAAGRRAAAAEQEHAQAEHGDHRDEGEDRDRRPALGSRASRRRGHPAIRRPPARQEVLDAADEPAERGRRPRLARARRPPGPPRRRRSRCRRAGSASGPGRRRAARPAGPGRASATCGSTRPRSPRTRSSRRCRRRRPRRSGGGGAPSPAADGA